MNTLAKFISKKREELYLTRKALSISANISLNDIDEIEEGDENVAYMLKEILGCIEDETTITVNYALWLADKDSVIDNYEGSEREIYGYKIDNAIVLSDLGWDGTLYGFEDEPEPVEIYDGENETVTESMIKKASVLLYD
jgi:hypothetical protein